MIMQRIVSFEVGRLSIISIPDPKPELPIKVEDCWDMITFSGGWCDHDNEWVVGMDYTLRNNNNMNMWRTSDLLRCMRDNGDYSYDMMTDGGQRDFYL
jgi:hypothetical protein